MPPVGLGPLEQTYPIAASPLTPEPPSVRSCTPVLFSRNEGQGDGPARERADARPICGIVAATRTTISTLRSGSIWQVAIPAPLREASAPAVEQAATGGSPRTKTPAAARAARSAADCARCDATTALITMSAPNTIAKSTPTAATTATVAEPRCRHDPIAPRLDVRASRLDACLSGPDACLSRLDAHASRHLVRTSRHGLGASRLGVGTSRLGVGASRPRRTDCSSGGTPVTAAPPSSP